MLTSPKISRGILLYSESVRDGDYEAVVGPKIVELLLEQSGNLSSGRVTPRALKSPLS